MSNNIKYIAGIKEHCSISNYVKQQIVVNFKRTTSMKDTDFEYSVSSNTVKRCLKSTEDTLNRVKKSLPNAIALDDFNSGTNITYKMSMLLINADTHKIFDVIRSRRDAALRSKDTERFSDIINQKLSTIPSRMRNAHRTLRKHKEEILLTLTHNYTNGPIEGKMNKIKILKP